MSQDIKRLRQLAGLEPLVEAWDPDDFDRYANVDNAFGVGKDTDRLVNDPDAVKDGEGPRIPGVRGPHVPPSKTSAAPEVKLPRRLTRSTIDPEIARQLAGEYEADAADDYDDEDGAGVPIASLAPRAAPARAAVSAADTAGGAMPAASKRGSQPRGKAALARSIIQANPTITRKEFMQQAAGAGMSAHYANTFFYNPSVKAWRASLLAGDADATMDEIQTETWTVRNNTGKVLAEGSFYDVPMWADYDEVSKSPLEPRVFEAEIYAKKVAHILTANGFDVRVSKEVLE